MTIKDKFIGAVVDNSVWILGAAIVHLLGAEGKLQIVLKAQKSIDSSGTSFEADIKVSQDAKIVLDKIVAAMPAGFLKDLAAAAEKAALALAPAADPAAPAAPSA